MTRIILLFSLFLFACNSASDQTSNQTADSLPPTDTSTIQKQDSAATPLLKLNLPRQKRTIKDIDQIVSEIDKFIEKGDWKIESVYGVNNEPCGIERYYKDSILMQIEQGCGDCSRIMYSEKYYFIDNSLIYYEMYVVDYGYNPCWSEKECIEYGVTDKFKKEELKERTEKYYFLDSVNFIFNRSGNFNDVTYFQNDTLSQKTILENANKYFNAKESR